MRGLFITLPLLPTTHTRISGANTMSVQAISFAPPSADQMTWTFPSHIYNGWALLLVRYPLSSKFLGPGAGAAANLAPACCSDRSRETRAFVDPLSETQTSLDLRLRARTLHN